MISSKTSETYHPLLPVQGGESWAVAWGPLGGGRTGGKTPRSRTGLNRGEHHCSLFFERQGFRVVRE